MSGTLTMIAWCDPGRRWARYSWAGIWVGVLEISRERLTYRMERREMVAADFSSAELVWLKSAKFTAARFDLHTADGSYRFYLSPPGNDAPPPSPDIIQSISTSLNHISPLGYLDGALGAVGDASGVLSNAISLPGAVAQLRTGNRNEQLIRDLLSGEDGGPSPVAPDVPPPLFQFARGDDDTWGCAVRFGPRGALAACAHSDGTIRFWDSADGRPIRTLKAYDKSDCSIKSMEFSADGRKLLVAGDQEAVLLWDVLAGTLVASLVHDEEVSSASMDRRSDWCVTVCDDLTTRVWNLRTRRIDRELRTSSDRAVTFSPSSERFATIGLDGLYSYASLSDPRPARDEDVGDGLLHLVAFSRQDLIAVADMVGDIFVFGADLERRLAHISHGSRMESLAFSPDGQLILGGDSEGEIAAWDVHTGNKVFQVSGEYEVSAAAWSPQGDRIATACLNGLLMWRIPRSPGR
ncbi:WD40 repeat domain-containing protein [Streptomyces sp. NPDC002623]